MNITYWGLVTHEILHPLNIKSLAMLQLSMCNVFLIKKMAPQLHELGVRAKCSCLSRFVHPSQHKRNKYPNPVSGHRLEGCLTIHQEVKNVSRRDQLWIIIHHDDFKMVDGEFIELHDVKRYFKVTEEGDLDLFFDDPGESQGQGEATLDPLPDVVGEVLNGQSEIINTFVEKVDPIIVHATCFWWATRVCCHR